MSKIKLGFLGSNKWMLRVIVLSWFFTTLLYFVLVFSLEDNFSVFNLLELAVFRGGFTILFTLAFLIKIYSRPQKNRLLYIVAFYFLVIFINSFPFKQLAWREMDLGAYSSLWFNLAFGMLMLMYVISTHLLYLREIKIESLKQQSLESQLNYQQLKNQLSPHFLFNNINVLTGLIEENPQKAVAFSSKLANIYRYFLEQEKQDVIVLKDELNFAKDYIELLQNRFENELEFSINTSEESNTKYIVATSLQQILENVIKHNEVSKEHKITISITDKDGYLVVSNNRNPKIADVKSNQNGLKNIKKRYAYFSDKKVEITQDEHQFSIQLPLLTL